jgi:hypothetical protein
MTTDHLPLPSAPYRGIEPFRYVNHRIFFEREAETTDLLRHIIVYKGVLLYGISGTGKSSLVNAGLIPEAIRYGFAPDRIRLQRRLGAEIIVEPISLRDDGKAPYLSPSLAGAEDDSPQAVFSLTQFEERLRSYSPGRLPLLIFD